jgi:hypothetical protein
MISPGLEILPNSFAVYFFRGSTDRLLVFLAEAKAGGNLVFEGAIPPIS